jgi:hypothetical protein
LSEERDEFQLDVDVAAIVRHPTDQRRFPTDRPVGIREGAIPAVPEMALPPAAAPEANIARDRNVTIGSGIGRRAIHS